MSKKWPIPIEGGCGCGTLRYRLEQSPLFIHCCNCHQCQCETGSAFVLNAMVEADEATLLPSAHPKSKGELIEPKHVLMPSESGKGQLVARCPHCYVAVWSHYAGAGPYVKFVRGGTLDKKSVDGRNTEHLLKPDIFIYTKFKQPWIEYPDYADTHELVMQEFYKPAEKWPEEVQVRYGRIKPQAEEWKTRDEGWKDAFPKLEDCR